MAELADAQDLKSCELQAHTGSIPVLCIFPSLIQWLNRIEHTPSKRRVAGSVAKRMIVWRSFSTLGSKLTRKSDGHVLDSYKTLYSDLVAQSVERLTSVDTGVSRLS